MYDDEEVLIVRALQVPLRQRSRVGTCWGTQQPRRREQLVELQVGVVVDGLLATAAQVETRSSIETPLYM